MPFSFEDGPFATTKSNLHTADVHHLYRKFGFDTPESRALERWSR